LSTEQVQPLRGWQRRAMVKYLAGSPRDFLAVATPGSGKTTFALRVVGELLGQRAVEQITVVVPTEHLKVQWARAAAAYGLALDPKFSNTKPQTSPEYHGVMVTYAQVAAHPTLHRVRTEQRKTLVVFDEIHHGGDAKTWGDAIREAFGDATRRLALTGTPFRSDDSPIPFVTYTSGPDGVARSEADHSYGYAEALADGVVRPVVFLAYSGEARWRDSAGDEHAARLGEPLSAEQTARAWRTALDPAGQWMPAVIAAADQRLCQLRTHVPDAGGMIIASDQAAARAYARQLTTITSEAPTLVLSDDPGSSTRITQFAESTSRWLVAVRMVSEGVDVPRLSVGIYATSASTPLFFAQAVGRFVRSRRAGETASIFLPSVPNLLQLASELEAQRNHVLGQPHRETDDPSSTIPPSQRNPRRPTQKIRRTASPRWGPTRNWIRSSSTDPRSAPPPPPAARRRPTTSASPGCWTPSRCAPCCIAAKTSSCKSGPWLTTASGSRPPRSPRTANCASCAANSTPWCRWPTTAPASRTDGSTTNCGAAAEALRSPQQPATSSRPASTPRGSSTQSGRET